MSEHRGAGVTVRLLDVAPPDPAPFSLDALAAAAARLPPECIEHHVGETEQLLPDGRVRTRPEPVADIIRSIADNGCWVMLRRLGALPEYHGALVPLSAPLQLAARAAGEHVAAHDLIVFVGAPRAGVPLHFDQNHHLLVQIQGTKTVGVGHYDDPDERVHQLGRGLRSHRLNADRAPDREQRFRLGPGQGLVLPAFTFHWVEGGDDVSIAAACVLSTEETAHTGARLRALTRS